MAAPLVTTKFHVPVSRRGVVARTRLNDRLTRVLESRLTLVSAPAGFGKSTLVAEWVAHGRSGRFASAWLALDDRDNDARRFWQYVIANYPIAVLKATKNQAAAQAYVDAIVNGDGQVALKEAGFLPPS